MQFVGGDQAEDVIPVLERLRAENKGALFVYSVEVDESEASGAGKLSSSETHLAHKQIVQENLHCIDVAADFEDRHGSGHTAKGTWVAIKLVSHIGRTIDIHHDAQFYLMVWVERDGTRCGVLTAALQVRGGQPSAREPLYSLPWMPPSV